MSQTKMFVRFPTVLLPASVPEPAKCFVLNRPLGFEKHGSPSKPNVSCPPHPPTIQKYLREAEQYRASLAQRRELFPERYQAMAEYVKDWNEYWNDISGDKKRDTG